MARDIERDVKEAFDDVRAGDALKERTRDAVLDQMHAVREGGVVSSVQYESNGSRRNIKRRVFAAAACFVFACLVAFGGHHVYITPVAAISVDINPSIELGVNCLDRVISADAYNEDGQELVDSLALENLSYEQAVECIVESSTVQALLASDESLEVSVACSDDARCDAMFSSLERCTSRYRNASCHHVDSDEVDDAHRAGLSFGKYRAYLAAHDADESLTVEDAQNMTMRELHDCANGHDATQSAAAAGQGQGYGNRSHGDGHHGRYHGEE